MSSTVVNLATARARMNAVPKSHDDPFWSLSQSALRLHLFAIAASIQGDKAGFVPDSYVAAIAVDPGGRAEAAELCDAKIWARVEGGYVVHWPEVLAVAAQICTQASDPARVGRTAPAKSARTPTSSFTTRGWATSI